MAEIRTAANGRIRCIYLPNIDTSRESSRRSRMSRRNQNQLVSPMRCSSKVQKSAFIVRTNSEHPHPRQYPIESTYASINFRTKPHLHGSGSASVTSRKNALFARPKPNMKSPLRSVFLDPQGIYAVKSNYVASYSLISFLFCFNYALLRRCSSETQIPKVVSTVCKNEKCQPAQVL